MPTPRTISRGGTVDASTGLSLVVAWSFEGCHVVPWTTRWWTGLRPDSGPTVDVGSGRLRGVSLETGQWLPSYLRPLLGISGCKTPGAFAQRPSNNFLLGDRL